MYEDYKRDHRITLDDLKKIPEEYRDTVMVIINGEYYQIDLEEVETQQTENDLPF